MSVEITHVRYGGYEKSHESIVRYKWRIPSTGAVGDTGKPAMVHFVDNEDIEVYVGSGASRASVGTVHPRSGEPYLRTYADGKSTNNLLSLPTF